MLSRLLKYEMRGLWKSLFPMFIVILGVSILVGIAGRAVYICDLNSYNGIVIGLLSGFTALGILGIYGVVVASAIIIFYRFYKSVATDEAYLTFTLPVSIKAHLFARVISAFVFDFLLSAVLIVSLMLGSLIACGNITMVFDFIIDFADIFDILKGRWLLYGSELFVFGLIASFATISETYFAIVIGSMIAKKKKGGAAILFILLVEFVISLIYEFSAIIIVFNMFATSFTEAKLQFVIWFYIVLTAGLGTLAFFLSENMLKKRLNLE